MSCLPFIEVSPVHDESMRKDVRCYLLDDKYEADFPKLSTWHSELI